MGRNEACSCRWCFVKSTKSSWSLAGQAGSAGLSLQEMQMVFGRVQEMYERASVCQSVVVEEREQKEGKSWARDG